MNNYVFFKKEPREKCGLVVKETWCSRSYEDVFTRWPWVCRSSESALLVKQQEGGTEESPFWLQADLSHKKHLVVNTADVVAFETALKPQ